MSYPLLVRLHALPRWIVTGCMLVLLVAGMAAPMPAGGVFLGVVVALMAWVTYLAWHEGERARRVVRVVALGLGVVALGLRLFGADFA